jgi:arsenate reductase (thioredoxin)
MQPADDRVFRVLFLCTGNSARSQMAEAVLNLRGRGRFAAESAGSAPAARVHPFAIEALREEGIQWGGHPPRGLDRLERESWDVVVTVCDHAREACPIFPGHPVVIHWSMSDPAVVEGSAADKRKAFADALRLITRRVDLLLNIPISSLERKVVQERLQSIAAVELAGKDPRREAVPGDGGHI